MKNIFSCTLFFGLASLIGYGSAFAQIAPDTSVGTTVTPDVMVNGVVSDRIDGGTVRGSNLFHSFSEFNINTGRGAYFTNPEGITNIFSRITGNNPSNINGILGVLGNANLFLLNPNGIVFGPNAKLDIGGSFFGTTANSIEFADGVKFSATHPTANPLLTVSVPVGLQMGSNPGTIQVQGLGHGLRTNNLNEPIAGAGTNSSGLRVQPGNTLALVGGDVTLAGGILSAPQGRLELGALANGTVSLNPMAQGWTLGWEGVQSLRNIQLSGGSLVDASGAGGGNIQLAGRQVTLLDGSIALIHNSGVQAAGTIGINAAETVNISGFTPVNQANSSLISSTVAGKGAEIAIVTRQLVGTGLIMTQAFNSSTGGNLNIRAADSVQLDGALRAPASNRNGLAALAFQSSQAGHITVTTNRFNLLNGTTLTSTTSGSGNAGNVFIQAQEAINVSGFSPDPPRPSVISASSFGTGNAGAIALNTARLTLEDGAVISTSFRGNSGSITVNATEAIELKGSFQQNPLLQTRISSAVFFLPQDLTGSSALPTGASGNITLNTQQLSFTNGGSVMVSNVGTGNGGTIRIQAEELSLDRGSTLTASTKSGEGGNIFWQGTALILRHGSNISTTAGGSGNGGNLTLNTNTVVALENSDITANAFQGRGGNIAIATQGLFRSTDSDITASSQLGLSGTVNISNLNFNQQNVVEPPPSNFVDSDRVVANSCLARQGNSQGTFVVTGNGGLPETPSTPIMLPYEVVQVQAIETGHSTLRHQESKAASPTWKVGDPIVEATEFNVNAQGQVVLTAKENSAAAAIAHPHPIPCHPN